MANKERFRGVIKEGTEAATPWFIFSVLGAILILLLLFLGMVLWIQNIWIAIGTAVILAAGAIILSLLLHNAKVTGKPQAILWVFLLLILGTTGIIGNHYLYHQTDSKNTSRSSITTSLSNRIDLLQRFNSVYEDFEEIEDCDVSYLKDEYEESKRQVYEDQYNLDHLSNPIIFVSCLMENDGQEGFEELSNRLSIIIENYNALNTSQCHYTRSLLDDFGNVEPSYSDPGKLAASIQGIHLLYILFIVLICSLMLLIPYGMAKASKTILKVRS